jgi:hypothetical protein
MMPDKVTIADVRTLKAKRDELFRDFPGRTELAARKTGSWASLSAMQGKGLT